MKIISLACSNPLLFYRVNLHSHKIRCWLHSRRKTESPDTFAQKENEICGMYRDAQEQSREGVHVISTDEMTGVQVLEHKFPDKFSLPGQCVKMKFEYIRHGTTSLIGFFDITTGRMERPYLNPICIEKDFVEVVNALVGTAQILKLHGHLCAIA